MNQNECQNVEEGLEQIISALWRNGQRKRFGRMMEHVLWIPAQPLPSSKEPSAASPAEEPLPRS